MSNFLYPPKFVVFQKDNGWNHWVPALFDHHPAPPYFVVGETLDELVSLIQDGGVTADADPVTDLRVVEIGSGTLYVLNGDRLAFSSLDPEWALSGPDKSWFEFH